MRDEMRVAVCLLLLQSSSFAAVPLLQDAPIDLPPIDTPPVDLPPIHIPPIDTPPVDVPPIYFPPLHVPPIDIPTSIPSTHTEIPLPDIPEVESPELPSPSPEADPVFSNNQVEPSPSPQATPFGNLDFSTHQLPDIIDEYYNAVAKVTHEDFYGGQAPYPAAADKTLAEEQIFDGMYPRKLDEAAATRMSGQSAKGQFAARRVDDARRRGLEAASVVNVWKGWAEGKLSNLDLDEKLGMVIHEKREAIFERVDGMVAKLLSLVTFNPFEEFVRVEKAYDDMSNQQSPAAIWKATIKDIDHYISRMNTEPRYLEKEFLLFLQQERTMNVLALGAALGFYATLCLITIRVFNMVVKDQDNYWKDLGGGTGFMPKDIPAAIGDVIDHLKYQVKRRDYVEEVEEMYHNSAETGLVTAQRVLEELGKNAPYIDTPFMHKHPVPAPKLKQDTKGSK